MIYETLAFLITIIISPLAYFVIGNYFIETQEKKWPIGYIDFLGDLIYLPLFNSLIIYFGLTNIGLEKTIISIGFGLIITTAFVLWRKNIAKHNDYTRPKKGVFNFLGWYHAGYMFLQAIALAYGLFLYYNIWQIYIPLVLYVVTITSRFVELGKTKIV